MNTIKLNDMQLEMISGGFGHPGNGSSGFPDGIIENPPFNWNDLPWNTPSTENR